MPCPLSLDAIKQIAYNICIRYRSYSSDATTECNAFANTVASWCCTTYQCAYNACCKNVKDPWGTSISRWLWPIGEIINPNADCGWNCPDIANDVIAAIQYAIQAKEQGYSEEEAVEGALSAFDFKKSLDEAVNTILNTMITVNMMNQMLSALKPDPIRNIMSKLEPILEPMALLLIINIL